MNPLANPYNAAKWLAALELLYQIVFVFFPITIWLVKWWGSHSFRSKCDRRLWLSQHPWYVVFVTINAVLFWASMSASHHMSMWTTLLGDDLVTVQMTFMVTAAALVTEVSGSSPVKSVEAYRKDWRNSLVIAILMNLSALWHSLTYASTQFEKGLWVVMNCLTVLFYLIILSKIRKVEKVEPPKLWFLWPGIVAPLALLSLLDLIRRHL